LCNSGAGGLIAGRRVGGGSGNWALAVGSIPTVPDKPTPLEDMTAGRRFSGPALEELADAKFLGVRARTEHRYTGVWVVLVEGRVFVRSWSDKPTGWYRVFQAQPLESSSVGSLRRARILWISHRHSGRLTDVAGAHRSGRTREPRPDDNHGTCPRSVLILEC